MNHFRFAVLSDPHIALPKTIWRSPKRFHLVEVSIPALESVLDHLVHLDLNFLLIPGDLTQHGEAVNHQWLSNRLSKLPFPCFVIPGNHDVPVLEANGYSIGFDEFADYYSDHGYKVNTNHLDYVHEVLPGIHLIALNSNQFNSQGTQLGCLIESQLEWLENKLLSLESNLTLLMIHHNVIEHLPNQSQHELGRRYMLDNAVELRSLLVKFGIKLVFTGHLHVQNIAQANGIYDITTGSLVSYPHPYRTIEVSQLNTESWNVEIESHRVKSLPGWQDLQTMSKHYLREKSEPLMLKLLMGDPLYLEHSKAAKIAPDLKDFWANIANGDAQFRFSKHSSDVNDYLNSFGVQKSFLKRLLTDNNTQIVLGS